MNIIKLLWWWLLISILVYSSSSFYQSKHSAFWTAIWNNKWNSSSLICLPNCLFKLLGALAFKEPNPILINICLFGPFSLILVGFAQKLHCLCLSKRWIYKGLVLMIVIVPLKDPLKYISIFRVCILSSTVKTAFSPRALVAISIRPNETSMPFKKGMFKFPFILSSVGEISLTIATHFVTLPLSNVFTHYILWSLPK